MAFLGWIDWVERTDAGVAVNFTQPRRVTQASLPEPRSNLGRSAPTERLELMLGDKYQSANGPSDDVSTGEAVMKDGVIGVFVTAHFDGISSSMFVASAETKGECLREAETHKERAAYRQEGESRFLAEIERQMLAATLPKAE